MQTDQLITAIERHLDSIGRNKTWLCKQLNVSTQTFNQWRKRRIPTDHLGAIASVFEWSLPDLMRGVIISCADMVDIPLYSPNQTDDSIREPAPAEGMIFGITASRRWLKATLAFSELKNLQVFTGRGNSMQPTYSHGDTLIVDIGINSVSDDGVYVLSKDGDIFVKRLEKMINGAIQVSSDNTDHKPYTIMKIELEEISIIGRVLWALSGKPL